MKEDSERKARTTMGQDDGIPLDPVNAMSQQPQQQQQQQQPMMMAAAGAPAPQYIYLQPGQMPPPGAQVYVMPPQAQPQPQPVGQPVYYPQPAAAPQQQQYVMMGGPPQQQYITIPPGQQQPYLMPAPVGMQPTIVYVNGTPKGPYFRSAVAVLVLYILGVTAGFWICDIFSLALSLHMARKKVIDKKHRPAVIALSILELIGWVFVGAFSWFFTEWTIYSPTSNPYSSYYRDPATGTYCYRQYSDVYPYGATNYYRCTVYYGWISFIVYFVFAIAFGIPRVVFTWKAKNNRSNHN
eukprot:TRINITY_DN361_c0_g1_i2.p2 TRINITY_DN361_c0_g1~~TRINITY_DN361_c0_g1_i2.p2  ORF type:complete len:296 (+),score=68.61 TRINITY_DN361_c0_g1_i2:1005-1892(+)